MNTPQFIYLKNFEKKWSKNFFSQKCWFFSSEIDQKPCNPPPKPHGVKGPNPPPHGGGDPIPHGGRGWGPSPNWCCEIQYLTNKTCVRESYLFSESKLFYIKSWNLYLAQQQSKREASKWTEMPFRDPSGKYFILSTFKMVVIF